MNTHIIIPITPILAGIVAKFAIVGIILLVLVLLLILGIWRAGVDIHNWLN